VVSDILRAAVVVVMPIAATANIWLVYPLVFLLTTISIFFRPARVAILPRLVRDDELLTANSALWVGETIADVIGFPLAGLFVALVADAVSIAFWFDGATYLDVFTRIILPLSGPVMATVSIIAFIEHWNSFLFPLVILNSPEKFTVSIGLRWFAISPVSDGRPLDHLLLAGSVMMTLPIMLLFFLGQRYFVRGVVMSGIKG